VVGVELGEHLLHRVLGRRLPRLAAPAAAVRASRMALLVVVLVRRDLRAVVVVRHRLL